MGKQSDRYQTFFTVLDLTNSTTFWNIVVYIHTHSGTHTHIYINIYIFYPYEIDFDALIEEGI